MFRQFSEPRREDYDTEEEYQEALDAYDAECLRREEYNDRHPYVLKFLE